MSSGLGMNTRAILSTSMNDPTPSRFDVGGGRRKSQGLENIRRSRAITNLYRLCMVNVIR